MPLISSGSLSNSQSLVTVLMSNMQVCPIGIQSTQVVFRTFGGVKVKFSLQIPQSPEKFSLYSFMPPMTSEGGAQVYRQVLWSGNVRFMDEGGSGTTIEQYFLCMNYICVAQIT